MALVINLGLDNAELYSGCEIEEVGGRKNLLTPPSEAGNIIGKNIAEIVAAVPAAERDQVTLTGPMAVWAYLVVFHAVLHAFNRVVYSDGRGNDLAIAAHGR